MNRISLSLIIVVVIAIVTISWGIGTYYDNHIAHAEGGKPNEIQIYETTGRSLAHLISNANNPEQLLTVWNDNSEIQLDIMALDDLPLPEKMMNRLRRGEVILLESNGMINLNFYLSTTAKILSLSVPQTELAWKNKPLNIILTLLFYSGIAIAVLVWFFPLIRRLQLLRSSAMALGGGDLNQRIVVRKSSYIADIEREFNRMADRIQTLVEDNKLLSRAVSHDLKTPLARLRFGIEAFSECGEQQRIKYQHRLESDLGEMEDLVETLLQFARLDDSAVEMNMVAVDLSRLCNEITDRHRDDQHMISCSYDDRIMISGNEKYLKMLVHNLVNNACDYCHQKIQLSIQETKTHICLRLEDDGPGIPEKDRQRVIKPFVRGAHQQQCGHGMGLAIVQRIAWWHKATLTIAESEDLLGASITVEFPKMSLSDIKPWL